MMATTGEGKVCSDPQFEGEAAGHTAPTVGREESTNAQLVVPCLPRFQPGKALHTFRMGLPDSVNQPSLRRFVY